MGVKGAARCPATSQGFSPWAKGKVDAGELLGVCPEWPEGTTTSPTTPPRSRLTYFNRPEPQTLPEGGHHTGQKQVQQAWCWVPVTHGPACGRHPHRPPVFLPFYVSLLGKSALLTQGLPARQFADTWTVKSDSAQASGEHRQGAWCLAWSRSGRGGCWDRGKTCSGSFW